MKPTSVLENYFSCFRVNTIGFSQPFDSPYGKQELIYADWTASGRAYGPIEEQIKNEIMPFLANTHTGSTVTSTLMSKAYEEAKFIVKQHVNASEDDILIFCGSGMTAAVNKFQRLLGIKVPERLKEYLKKENTFPEIDEELRPVVFVTHMEHHSNQVSWLETIATVKIIKPDTNGNVDLEHFQILLEQFKHRKNKIAAITACSNVTGIQTPYKEIAKMVHASNGFCFVDFACSAPYVQMDMHPMEKGTHLDAIYFSPHKFLGGPGSTGVLIFNQKLYKNRIPDQPGGRTVLYSNPWGVHEYVTDIEFREDGGTPALLQGIKVAMCIRLKEKMGVDLMQKREEELLELIFDRFSKITNVELLEGRIKKRLGVVSFILKGAHYNLIVSILNDRFGIQTRGGCSCAATYGHKLLKVSQIHSYEILDSIRSGDLFCKPGWIRLSIHPTMSNVEINLIMDAIEMTAQHFREWSNDYHYDPVTNEYTCNIIHSKPKHKVKDLFNCAM